MGDFSFLDSGAQPLRRNTTTNSRSRQDAAAAPPPAAAAAGATQQQQQQQQQPRVRIQLPSFRQVQAAEAPARPISTFRPSGSIDAPAQQAQSSQPQQQPLHQQQQQQPAPSWLQQPAAAAEAAAGSSAPTQAPLLAAAAPTQQQQQQQQPSWMAGLPSMTLNTQLPRFSQAASGGSTGSAVGISRPAVQLPAAGPSQGQAAAGGGGATHQPQQQQVPVNAVLVSRRQQGNPVLKHIKSVRWVFADIVPDYLCGPNTAVLFLSLRYHLLQPEYVLSRLQALQRVYRLAVLLLVVDAEEVVKPLLELHRAALGAQAVLVCAWSNEECARYIETFKAYENRPASSIMEHTDTDYMGRLSSVLTSIRGINRSDAYSLARHFGSLADVLQCNELQGFASIPGLGPVKARRLLDTFNQPFRRGLTAANTAVNTQAPASTGAAGASSCQQQQQQQQQQQGAAGAAASQGLAGRQGSQNPDNMDEGLDEELVLEYEAAAKEVAAAGGAVGVAAASVAFADEGLEQGQEVGKDDGEGEYEEAGEEEVDFDQLSGLMPHGYHDSQEQHYLELASDDAFDAEEF